MKNFYKNLDLKKREKYFDWLTRGGRGGWEGAPPCLVVLAWYFIGSEVVFWGIQVGSDFVDGRFCEKRMQSEAGDFGNFSHMY